MELGPPSFGLVRHWGAFGYYPGGSIYTTIKELGPPKTIIRMVFWDLTP